MSFSVATYNVLADAYIRPEWYPFTPGRLLDPSARLPLLLDHLVALDVDLLCLQEVEPGPFAAMKRTLAPLGYEGSLLQKSSGKPDGCATFYRRDVFDLADAARLDYAAAPGHIAQILSLQDARSLLGIANTHLRWVAPATPPEEHRGDQQVAQLLEERERKAPGCQAWILCGDLNAEPGSAAIVRIERAGFASSHADLPGSHTSNANQRAKTIDYIFHSSALGAEPLAVPAIDDHTPLPGPDQPSDHVALRARFHWA